MIMLVIAGVWLASASIPVLQPAGTIGRQELWLMGVALGLCLIVVVPVYFMLFSFAWKYRANNKKARYQPDFDHSNKLEALWWGIPLLIISVLAVITWRSSHYLDPFRPLASSQPALSVQAVALDWKWLFIYPEQGVASLNFLQIPVNRPVNLSITSDAPMNSLWIPQLGGQIYAMSGMSTHLNLMADKPGDYYGSSANISGTGFAGMHFTARAGSQIDFDQWIKQAKQSRQPLSLKSYSQLAQPSSNQPVSYYAPVSNGLYDYIVNKFVTPPNFAAQEVR